MSVYVFYIEQPLLLLAHSLLRTLTSVSFLGVPAAGTALKNLLIIVHDRN